MSDHHTNGACSYGEPKVPILHCTGCTDERSEGTHQGCTIEHGHIGCDLSVPVATEEVTNEEIDAAAALLPPTEINYLEVGPTIKCVPCDRVFPRGEFVDHFDKTHKGLSPFKPPAPTVPSSVRVVYKPKSQCCGATLKLKSLKDGPILVCSECGKATPKNNKSPAAVTVPSSEGEQTYFAGMPIVVDESLAPAEWRLEKGVMHQAPATVPMGEWETEFDAKVKELDSPRFLDNKDGEVAYFGYKTIRVMKNYREVFTVTDWGNIKSFIARHLLAATQRGREEAEKIWKPRTEVSYKEGWDAARTTLIDTLVEEIGDMVIEPRYMTDSTDEYRNRAVNEVLSLLRSKRESIDRTQ